MSLLAIGPTSIPTLAKVCQNTNENVRMDAALMIAILKVSPPPYFDGWDWQKAPVNGQPIFSIGYAVSSDLIRKLVELLEDPDAAVRRASADALGRYLNPPYNQIAPNQP